MRNYNKLRETVHHETCADPLAESAKVKKRMRFARHDVVPPARPCKRLYEELVTAMRL